MLKCKHILLAASLIELAIGFSDARPTAFFYLGRPLGAVLLGLFLIAQVMEKESALYDEQRRALQPAPNAREARPQPPFKPQGAPHNPSLTIAHSR